MCRVGKAAAPNDAARLPSARGLLPVRGATADGQEMPGCGPDRLTLIGRWPYVWNTQYLHFRIAMFPDHPRKRRLVHFIRQVWDEGDASIVDEYVAETYIIYHDPGDPWDGATLDRAGFKDRLVRSRAAFPDQRFDVQAMFSEGDDVAMTWLWAATHSGDLPGFPATDKRIVMSGAIVYKFNANDQLTGHWQITDRLGVFQQLQRNATRT